MYRVLLWCSLIFCLGAAPAYAQRYPGLPCPEGSVTVSPEEEPANPSRSYWMHNGSVVSLTAEGETRRIHYHDPRPGMRAVGAERGTLLFDGRSDGTSFSGTAYIFTTQCGPIPYDVRGVSSNGKRRITLRGRAPSRVDRNCQITAYRDDVLVFNYRRSE